MKNCTNFILFFCLLGGLFMSCNHRQQNIPTLLQQTDSLLNKEHYRMAHSQALVAELGGALSDINCNEKRFELALKAGDTLFACHILHNYSDTLMCAHRNRESIAQLQRLIRIDSTFRPSHVQLSLAINYANLGMTDSAVYYTDKAERTINEIQKHDKTQTNHQMLKVRIMSTIILLLAVVIIIIIAYQQNLRNKEHTIRSLSNNLQNYIQQQKENEVRIKQNKEYIRSLQAQPTDQKKDQHSEQFSLITQLELQNKNLTQSNQDLQQQIETNWKKLKETQLKTQHIQELTTEMLLLKEREQKLTEQLIAVHPLINELRKSPRFIHPADLAVLRQLTDEIYQNFTSRLSKRFTNLTDADLQLCILIRLGFSIPQIATFTAISPTSVSQQKSRTKKRIQQQDPDSFTEGETLDLWLRKF